MLSGLPSVRCPCHVLPCVNTYSAWRHNYLAQMIIMWVEVAEKVFKVRGHRSRSYQDQMHFCGGGLHFDGVTSMLTCYILRLFARSVCRMLFLLVSLSETASVTGCNDSLSVLVHPKMIPFWWQILLVSLPLSGVAEIKARKGGQRCYLTLSILSPLPH